MIVPSLLKLIAWASADACTQRDNNSIYQNLLLTNCSILCFAPIHLNNRSLIWLLWIFSYLSFIVLCECPFCEPPLSCMRLFWGKWNRKLSSTQMPFFFYQHTQCHYTPNRLNIWVFVYFAPVALRYFDWLAILFIVCHESCVLADESLQNRTRTPERERVWFK